MLYSCRDVVMLIIIDLNFKKRKICKVLIVWNKFFNNKNVISDS